MAHNARSLKRPHACPLASHRANGFTLIELLVVIGIIALLAGLLLVTINKVYRQGSRTKVAIDLQAIASALDAYKADFGSYPAVDRANIGAAVLCKALFGPSPKPATASWKQGQFQVGTATPPNEPPSYIALVDNPSGTPTPAVLPTSDWAIFSPFDGADGNAPEYRQIGFRVGPKTIDTDGDETTTADRRPGGRVWGPYLAPEKFLTKVDSGMMFDSVGNPILYFPASTPKPNVAQVGNLISYGGRPLFDANDNLRFFIRSDDTSTAGTPEIKATARMAAMLGDFNCNGAVDAQFNVKDDDVASSLPYLLWTAGDDGFFGPPIDATKPNYIYVTPTSADQVKANQKAVEKCDDVTNFTTR